ncbi:MAG: hypothetical protein QXH07_01800 [Thermoplasmata archaeon]
MFVIVAELVGIVSGISALGYSFYKIGAWTGRINTSLKELSNKVDVVTESLNNHIFHYDTELSNIRQELKEIGDNIAKKQA